MDQCIHTDKISVFIKQRSTGVTMRNERVMLEGVISNAARNDVRLRDNAARYRLACHIV